MQGDNNMTFEEFKKLGLPRETHWELLPKDYKPTVSAGATENVLDGSAAGKR